MQYVLTFFPDKNEIIFADMPISDIHEISIYVNKIYSLDKVETTLKQDTELSAKSIAIYDINSNQIVYEKNSDQRLQIASLTKLASTKVLANSVNLDSLRTVNEEVIKYNGGFPALKPEQVYSVNNLLKSAVIASNNESLYVIQDSEKTVNEMNHLKEVLQLDNTSFENPAGFDNERNYSSARDMIYISKVFFGDNRLLEFSSTIRAEINDANTNSKIRFTNTNDLLRLRGEVVAGKTGTTPRAGQNLILLAEKNGKEYIIAILNSKDRYNDARIILDNL